MNRSMDDPIIPLPSPEEVESEIREANAILSCKAHAYSYPRVGYATWNRHLWMFESGTCTVRGWFGSMIASTLRCLKILMQVENTRNDYFAPTTIGMISGQKEKRDMVKVHARFEGFSEKDSGYLYIEDDDSKIIVEYSSVEVSSCEKGEWYRWLGEIKTIEDPRNGTSVVLKLHLAPVLATGFDPDEYEKSLFIRSNFISEFDSLVSYACKHK